MFEIISHTIADYFKNIFFQMCIFLNSELFNSHSLNKNLKGETLSPPFQDIIFSLFYRYEIVKS